MKNFKRLIILLLTTGTLWAGFWAVGLYLGERDAGIARKETHLPNAGPDEFRIAGIGLDLPDDQVRRSLGQPLRQRVDAKPSFQNTSYTVYRTRWFYPGLEIWFLSSAANHEPVPRKERRTIKIIVTRPGYKTFRGVGVGDSRRDVIRNYGRGVLRNGSLDYSSDLGDIGFTLVRSRVSRIEIDADID